MSYHRVIPRDLFNEAKLLKCLGQLSLIALDQVDSHRNSAIGLEVTNNGEAFNIVQDIEGNLRCTNVEVSMNGERVDVYSPYNSKERYPLQFGDNQNVFNVDGSMANEFLLDVIHSTSFRATA